MPTKCLFLKEWADLVKRLTDYILPEIIHEVQPKDIISYYKKDESYKGKEINLIEMYKDTIVIYPNIPNLNHNDMSSPTELFMLSSFEYEVQNAGSIYITSFLEECTVIAQSRMKSISDFTWEYTPSDRDNIFKPEKFIPYEDRTSFNLKVLNKPNTEYRINTIIAFDKNKTQIENPYKLSIQYLTYLNRTLIDQPHERIKIIYNYMDISSTDKCICDINKLGTNECPFQLFIDDNCTQNILSDIVDVIFDIKEKINNNEYKKLMNKIKTLNEQIK